MGDAAGPAAARAGFPGRGTAGPEAPSREVGMGQGGVEGTRGGVREGGMKGWVCRVLQ